MTDFYKTNHIFFFDGKFKVQHSSSKRKQILYTNSAKFFEIEFYFLFFFDLTAEG